MDKVEVTMYHKGNIYSKGVYLDENVSLEEKLKRLEGDLFIPVKATITELESSM